MKKIAVITYCEWNSYGSILQAYGLKKTLEGLGCEETIYKTFQMESPVHKRVKKNIKSIAGYVLSLPKLKKLNRVYQRNFGFIQSNFHIVYYKGYEALRSSIPACDGYLAGSDQVWNPEAPQKEMFLDFDTYGKKRLSYAASFGVSSIKDEHRAYITERLQCFDAISVREPSMVPVIQKLHPQLSPQVHIDPVFLLSRDAWRSLSAKREGIPSRYILVYALYWNSEINRDVMRLSKEQNLPVISVQLRKRQIYSDKKLLDCDIREFLWLIDHAAYVITSSFHGLAFSLIFQKKFSAVINPQAPDRLTDLLALFSLENRAIRELSPDMQIDYPMVERKIAEEKDRSVQYLRSVLS